MPRTPSAQVPLGNSRAAFDASPYASLKLSTYFDVYDRLLAPFVGRNVTFVEVGILHGGSLWMWRGFLGPHARIIGVDVNPDAVRWREHGFEVFIGDQSDPAFWQSFFEEVGPVDVLLDDGGHTFEQQVVTTESALPYVRDGGLVIVEDVISSYMPEFLGPSRNSFVAYTKHLMDRIHARHDFGFSVGEVEDTVLAMHVHQSLVALEVNREACTKPSTIVWNDGAQVGAEDYREALIASSFDWTQLRRLGHLAPRGVRRIVARTLLPLHRRFALWRSNRRARRAFQLRKDLNTH